ncbi:hypothetical protein BCV70DRAFT_198344 [Testicularia cyperi]|uniref:Uncharacterized protein n=1 Tax=Testicularia cyperi TaxID=1882483 RepID=A0A317XW60_9BASI|nr:hypothetical protein BCV70DRAFT_198344 [Testicularia cyperi]
MSMAPSLFCFSRLHSNYKYSTASALLSGILGPSRPQTLYLLLALQQGVCTAIGWMCVRLSKKAPHRTAPGSEG